MGMASLLMGFLMLVLFVVLPLIAGAWLIVASRKKGLGFPACGGCQYDLSGTIGAATRCPECGAEFAVVGILAPGGARNRKLLWSGIVVLMIPITCTGFLALSRFAASQRAAQARVNAVVAQQQQAAVLLQQQAATSTQTATTQPASSAASPTAEPPDDGK
jgi:hypothetical protein